MISVQTSYRVDAPGTSEIKVNDCCPSFIIRYTRDGHHVAYLKDSRPFLRYRLESFYFNLITGFNDSR